MSAFINIHTHHQTSSSVIEIVNHRFGVDEKINADIFFSIGIHPWDIEMNFSLPELEKDVLHPNCFAIGECGLDKNIKVSFSLQKEIFISHLNLALKYNKPVIIHCVKAFDDLIDTCIPYQQKLNLIIHGYNKSIHLAKRLIANGFYLSLNEKVINKSNVDLNQLDLTKLFFETDNNSALQIESVYVLAAKKLNIEIEALQEIISCNFKRLTERNFK